MNQNPLTDEQLNEIEARANAATQDPWLCTETEDVRVLLAEVRRMRAERDELIRQRNQIAMDTLKAIAADGAPEPGGARQCGHDDYHDPHEWADRPGVWCPGHSVTEEGDKR